MIKLPINSKWTQPNNSDKFGSLWATKNINLDEEGYLKLSPRTVSFFNGDADVSNIGSTDFKYPVAFGRTDPGTMYIATTDEPFNLSVSETTKTIAEDDGSNNPNLVTVSHGVWWQNRFHESTDTAVYYKTAGTWTANAITGLTSGKRHYMEVFKNRDTLCVANGNVLKQYDTSYSASTDLTLPSDFEIIGLAYNNYRMGIITRLGSDTAGQNSECFFFSWDGASDGANQGVPLGSYTSFAITPYKSSFLIINSVGQLLYWNGGGFDILASFPFYYSEHSWGDLLNFISYGDNIVVDGEVIYINIGFDLDNIGEQGVYMQNNPSGVWCYDPVVGLYHRWSPSNSNCYKHTISSANVDLDTNTFTTSETIPSTGNPIRLTSGSVGGLKTNEVYYVIKVSDTTFQIAETKEKALAGVEINITSKDTNQYFWIYDLVDYGISYFSKSGAIALWGTSTLAYKDVIFGGLYDDLDLSSIYCLCSAIPYLENRGYFITPKIYTGSIKDIYQKLFIKYRPLNTNDKIIVKVKREDIFGLPVAFPHSTVESGLTWTSANEGYTAFDLSKAKTAFDAGKELELELISGAGAGQMVKITEINEESGTYSLVLAEDVIGAVSGRESYFKIDNWETIHELNYDNQTGDGVYELPITESSKWLQLKVELRGYETTIEEFILSNAPNKQ